MWEVAPVSAVQSECASESRGENGSDGSTTLRLAFPANSEMSDTSEGASD